MKKLFTLTIAVLSLVQFSIAQTDAGDMAFIAFNVDGDSRTPGSSNDTCPEVNEECDGAITIDPSFFGQSVWQTFALGDSASEAGCAGDANDDVWFSFVAQSANDVILAQDPTGGYDVAIEVYSDCGVFLECFENYGAGAIERALPGATPGNELVIGNTYYFRVYDIAADTSASTNVRVMVKTFTQGSVRPGYCGYLAYSFENFIVAEEDASGELYTNPAVGVKQYGFRFEEPGVGVVAEVINPDYQSWLILGDVPGLELNTVYDVTVRHTVGVPANGDDPVQFYWSEYGSACQIGIGQYPLPAARLRDKFCPPPAPMYLKNHVSSTAIDGADLYEFTFIGGGESFIKTRPSYQLFLKDVGTVENGLKYNSTVYDVVVRARVNGEWTDYGDKCQITMAAKPETTQLQTASCIGGPYQVGFTPVQKIKADRVKGAILYQFRFGSITAGARYVRGSSNQTLKLKPYLTFLNPGDWDVEVRVLAGGQQGDWGSACTITIEELGSMADGYGDGPINKLNEQEDLIVMDIYPNPNEGQEFMLALNNTDELLGQVTVEVLDMMGRQMHVQHSVVDVKENALVVRPDRTLSAGIYSVRLIKGDQQIVSIMIVE